MASEYYGQVTFGGFAVPGATITAIQGAKKITVTSDEGGRYRFDDLPDGQWTIGISLQCFATIHAEVTVAANTAAGKWELTLLPPDELKALAKPVQPGLTTQPTLQVEAGKKPDTPDAASTPVEIPKPPD